MIDSLRDREYHRSVRTLRKYVAGLCDDNEIGGEAGGLTDPEFIARLRHAVAAWSAPRTDFSSLADPPHTAAPAMGRGENGPASGHAHTDPSSAAPRSTSRHDDGRLPTAAPSPGSAPEPAPNFNAAHTRGEE